VGKLHGVRRGDFRSREVGLVLPLRENHLVFLALRTVRSNALPPPIRTFFPHLFEYFVSNLLLTSSYLCDTMGCDKSPFTVCRPF